MTNKDIELERTALEAAAVHRYDPHFERFCNPCGKTLGWRPARSGCARMEVLGTPSRAQCRRSWTPIADRPSRRHGAGTAFRCRPRQ